MASFSIDQLRALPDFQQVTKWDVRFLQLPVVGALAFPLAEGINLRCESIEVPKRTNTKIEVDIRGHKVRQPGITEYTGTMTLTFTETVDNTIKSFIKAWTELVWGTRSGSQFAKTDLEGVMQIQMLNNQDEPIYEMIVYGVFPEDHDFGTLDGATSDIVRPSLTMSFDFFTERPL